MYLFSFPGRCTVHDELDKDKYGSLVRFFFNRGIFLDFLCTLFNIASSTAPQIPVSEDAGIELRSVASSTLAVRRSNH
jgi:hypothetical protein